MTVTPAEVVGTSCHSAVRLKLFDECSIDLAESPYVNLLPVEPSCPSRPFAPPVRMYRKGDTPSFFRTKRTPGSAGFSEGQLIGEVVERGPEIVGDVSNAQANVHQ